MKSPTLFHIIILLWLIPFNARAYTSEDCMVCHREGSEDSRLRISITEFQNSAHGGELACEDCHAGVMDKDHENIKGSGAVDCNECHDQENRHGLSGDRKNRPQCHSCHGKHTILGKDNRASAIYMDQLKKTCSKCHPMECGDTGYLAWLPSIQIRSHKKQDFSQDYGKGNCIGCHQGPAVHGEEESLDGQNCQVCHMNLNENSPVKGTIHPGTDFKKQPAVFFAGIIYQVFILILLWGVYRFFSGRISGKSGKRGR
jgi:hypothetical protein